MDFKRALPDSLCIRYSSLYLCTELKQQELIQLPFSAEAI